MAIKYASTKGIMIHHQKIRQADRQTDKQRDDMFAHRLYILNIVLAREDFSLHCLEMPLALRRTVVKSPEHVTSLHHSRSIRILGVVIL